MATRPDPAALVRSRWSVKLYVPLHELRFRLWLVRGLLWAVHVIAPLDVEIIEKRRTA